MFTGIIQKVEKAQFYKDRVIVKNPFDNIFLGESISVNGICLTVDTVQDGFLFFSVGKETQERTNIRYYNNKFVNLERSVSPYDLLGGHIIYGHVDGIVRLISIRKLENTYWLRFGMPKEKWAIVEKGSISLNGISLTVARKGIDFFDIQVIDHTYKNTNLKFTKSQDLINYEIDIFARYMKNIKETMV